MVRTVARLVLASTLMIAVAGIARAQSPAADANAQKNKPKKHANQMPDTGVEQPAPDDSAEPLERVIENVPVTVRADGTVVARLDESFMEATTVTLDATGSLRFAHYTGLERAAEAVRGRGAAAGTALPARKLPLLFPILEERE